MLIRIMNQLEAEGRVISISDGESSAVRPLTKSDGVGFSVSEAGANAGEVSDLWYKHHLGFLRRMRAPAGTAASGAQTTFEVRRILKAFVDAEWLAELDAQLAAYWAEFAGREGVDAELGADRNED